MNSFQFRKAIALVVTALIAPLQAAAAEQQPNIVLIVTDDQGWADLGVHGNPVLETPNMDQLSRDGVEFTLKYRACWSELPNGRVWPIIERPCQSGVPALSLVRARLHHALPPA